MHIAEILLDWDENFRPLAKVYKLAPEQQHTPKRPPPHNYKTSQFPLRATRRPSLHALLVLFFVLVVRMAVVYKTTRATEEKINSKRRGLLQSQWLAIIWIYRRTSKQVPRGPRAKTNCCMFCGAGRVGLILMWRAGYNKVASTIQLYCIRRNLDCGY